MGVDEGEKRETVAFCLHVLRRDAAAAVAAAVAAAAAAAEAAAAARLDSAAAVDELIVHFPLLFSFVICKMSWGSTSKEGGKVLTCESMFFI